MPKPTTNTNPNRIPITDIYAIDTVADGWHDAYNAAYEHAKSARHPDPNSYADGVADTWAYLKTNTLGAAASAPDPQPDPDVYARGCHVFAVHHADAWYDATTESAQWVEIYISATNRFHTLAATTDRSGTDPDRHRSPNSGGAA